MWPGSNRRRRPGCSDRREPASRSQTPRRYPGAAPSGRTRPPPPAARCRPSRRTRRTARRTACDPSPRRRFRVRPDRRRRLHTPPECGRRQDPRRRRAPARQPGRTPGPRPSTRGPRWSATCPAMPATRRRAEAAALSRTPSARSGSGQGPALQAGAAAIGRRVERAAKRRIMVVSLPGACERFGAVAPYRAE